MENKLSKWVAIAMITLLLMKTIAFDFYAIPSDSMEGTINIGDHVVISKTHYGCRLPITLLQIPFGDLYLDWIQFDENRLPAFSNLQRSDIIVFNYPPQANTPVDQKTVYIKRCVAVAGDTISSINADVFVNGVNNDTISTIKRKYYLTSRKKIENRTFISSELVHFSRIYKAEGCGQFEYVVVSEKSKIVSFGNRYHDVKISPMAEKDRVLDNPALFSFSELPWDASNYGPIFIPMKGSRIELNEMNVALYAALIRDYEPNKNVLVKANKVIIDGEVTNEYVFKNNYCFVLGDNRTSSQDSRYWGFLPYSHIIGKAVAVIETNKSLKVI